MSESEREREREREREPERERACVPVLFVSGIKDFFYAKMCSDNAV